MPFKSQAQKAKFQQMLGQGKISRATFNEFNKDTPSNLPKRLGKKNGKKAGNKVPRR